MNKKIIMKIFIVLFIILVCIGLFFLKFGVNNSRLDLSNVQEIVVTNNGETNKYKSGQKEFDCIESVFKNKMIKTETDRVHFWDDYSYKIEFITDSKKYILYGSPEINMDENGGKLNNPVVFVLHDNTNETTMEYSYELVKISKSDFLKMFPNSFEEMKNEISQKEEAFWAENN